MAFKDKSLNYIG